MIRRLVFDALQVPPEISGVGRQLMAMGEALEREGGEEIVLRAPRDVADALGDDFPARTRFETPLPSSRPRLRRILYQQLVAPLRDRRGTAVVCAGDQAPLWGRARVILVAHDVRRLQDPGTSGRAERIFYGIVQPRSVRRASVIVTVSEFSRKALVDALAPTAPIIVAKAHPALRVDAPNTDGAASREILVVGALRTYKGIETVIEAVSRVPGIRARFIGGDEGRREELEAFARAHGVADRVVLAGWVPEAELEDAYRTALAVVSASAYEGYGLPVAEGLVRGLPVLASRIPAHVEVAGDAARYFEPRDATGLAAAIADVAGSEAARQALATRSFARAQELAVERRGWGWAMAQARAAASA